MFERYSEKSRRTIFFARYEASQAGSAFIEAEHLLLALLREDGPLGLQLFGGTARAEEFRHLIESRRPKKRRISTSVDLPLSQECHMILQRADKEAEQFDSRYIETGHLMLALLAEEKCLAVVVLNELGIAAPEARDRLLRGRKEPAERGLRITLDAVIAAWLRRDLDSILALVGDEALLIDVNGAVHLGKESLRLIWPEGGKGARAFDTRRISIEQVRLVRLDVALVTALCDIANPSELGSLHQVRAALVLCRTTTGWEIASAQLTGVRTPAE